MGGYGVYIRRDDGQDHNFCSYCKRRGGAGGNTTKLVVKRLGEGTVDMVG